MLNLLQRLALDFTDIFVCNFPSDYLTDKCKENFKKGFRSSRACNALNFFQQIP